MDFLSWNDFIQPTNPYASIFFGVIVISVLSLIIWLDDKNVKKTAIVFVSGFCFTIVGVALLNFFGAYG
ncbi:hypothetical protein VBD025_14480 [Virgibacillus flavescens]|uniref:hypothetical protein n=1 Tax=Virgibacillus flavescens TaxID=1611422 RepID=UPI003D33FE22